MREINFTNIGKDFSLEEVLGIKKLIKDTHPDIKCNYFQCYWK